MSEVEDLKDEVKLLRLLLDGQQKQNDILHNTLSDRASQRINSTPTVIYNVSTPRMSLLEHTVDVLDSFASELANYDCYGEGDAENKCGCMPCRAQAALDHVKDWRYNTASPITERFKGSYFDRTTSGWNPREAKIHKAWVKHMETWSADRYLGQILTERPKGGLFETINWPTPRDWYVANSVVQWLVTNVGSSILEAAGWQYTQYNEDIAALEELRKQHATT